MRELFRIPRVALPAWTRRSLALAVAGVIVLSVVINPGVSGAVALFTMQKASKISLGNTNTITQAGTAAPSTVVAATVPCPAGHQAIGGGADSPSLAGSTPTSPIVFESAPVGTGKSVAWYVEVYNSSSTDPAPFTAYAICSP